MSGWRVTRTREEIAAAEAEAARARREEEALALLREQNARLRRIERHIRDEARRRAAEADEDNDGMPCYWPH